jgi:pilus assembly protein CpaE
MSTQIGKSGDSRALLICPDTRMSAELSELLASELPAAKIAALDVYPDRGEVAAMAAEAQVCFLDVTTDAEAAFALLAWLAAEIPQLPVVVLFRSNDPDLILRCLRNGGAEFLMQPFTHDQFTSVFGKLARLRNGLASTEQARGKVYCVVPGKGASGATTLACNLVFALKRLHAGRVLLADLDGLTGTAAFVLKLKSPYSFVDAVSHAGALEPDVWKAVVASYHGIDVLLSPENPVDCYAEALNPTLLIGSARQSYDTIVLDAGGMHGDWNTALARLADELLVVTTNDLPALHATRRALASLERNGVMPSKSRIVVNRHRSKFGLAEGEAGKALGALVFRTLPADHEAIGKALIEGRPVPPGSAFGRSVAALSLALSGVEPPTQKSSIVSSLVSLFHR